MALRWHTGEHVCRLGTNPSLITIVPIIVTYTYVYKSERGKDITAVIGIFLIHLDFETVIRIGGYHIERIWFMAKSELWPTFIAGWDPVVRIIEGGVL